MKHKILFYDPTFGVYAGAQKVCINMLNILSKHYEIKSLSRHTDTVYYKDLCKSGEVQKLPFESKYQKYLGKGDNDSLSFFPKLFRAINMIYFTLINNLYLLYSCKKDRVNILYTYDLSGLILSSLFLRLFKIKVVWHLHGELHYSVFAKKIFFLLADKVVVPSDFIYNSINFHSNKKVRIYNGFEFEGIDSSNRCKDFKSMLYAGSLVPHKGLHKVIIGLSDVREAWQLDVLGEFFGKYESSYRDYINTLIKSLPDHITVNFHGWIDNTSKFFKNADIFVFPSVSSEMINLDNVPIRITSSEALPTVLIESLAYGTPVFANSVAGVKEIVEKNTYGKVSESEFSSEFSEFINSFKPSCYAFDSSSIRNKFSINSMKKEVYILFKGLI